MSSNLDNRTSSVRDIAKLFPEGKRLGTKSSDLVSGTALTKCLDVHEAFEVLGTSPEQRSPRRAGAEEVNRRFRGRFESEVALLERRFLAHQPEAGPNQLRECFIIYWFTP